MSNELLQVPQKRCITLTRLTFVAVFLIAVLAVIVVLGWYLAATRLPIKPETATQTQLVKWLVLRDFAAEPVAVQDALVDKFEAVFGISSGKMPQFKFSETTQKIIRSVAGKRDYKTRSERNSVFLVRRLIERSRLAYTKAPRDGRNAIVQHTASQLAWWEQLQVAYCNAIGVAPPTQAELMEEFKQIFSDIIADTPEAERAAVKQYKTILTAALLLQQIKPRATLPSAQLDL